MRTLFAPLFAALFVFSTSCMANGDIDDSTPGARRDAGPASGNKPPASNDGGGPAPTPPDDPTDDAGTPDSAPDGAPTPAGDDGGAPTPPPPGDASVPDTNPGPTAPYPSGPYAIATGSVYPNLSLNGYRDGAGAWTSLTARDYYDPTGSRGIKVLVVAVSAAWCAPCQAEAKSMPSYKAKYDANGVRFLEVLIEDTSGAGATQSTVDAWKTMASLDVDVAADPGHHACPAGSIGLPFNALVDAKTMQVIDTWSGTAGGDSIPEVDNYLATH